MYLRNVPCFQKGAVAMNTELAPNLYRGECVCVGGGVLSCSALLTEIGESEGFDEVKVC
jgi:hypothetical protein